MPERFHVVTPDPAMPVHSYRWDEYAAYYRLLKRSFLATLTQGTTAILEATYPEPVEHCEVCRWWDRYLSRRRADDHLSFIAGASRTARAELEANDVRTLAAAGRLPVPLPFKPSRGLTPTYVRLREQARVQLEQRERRRLVWELAQRQTPRAACCACPSRLRATCSSISRGRPMRGRAVESTCSGSGRAASGRLVRRSSPGADSDSDR